MTPTDCIDVANTGDGLAQSGVDYSILAMVAVAGGIIVLGIMLLAPCGVRRRRGALLAAALLVLVVGMGIGSLSVPTAQAAPGDCDDLSVSVALTQTSALNGLGPGVAPLAITGVIANPGTDDLRVDSIVVSISGITKAAGAVAGACGAGDFSLTDAHMPVNVTLGPRTSANFAGASISFVNSTLNQDACKGASVSLRYDASGS